VASLAVGLPLAGLGLIGFGVVVTRRRRSAETTTA
jgi:LPXTG-motif cell wall-anchored protein